MKLSFSPHLECCVQNNILQSFHMRREWLKVASPKYSYLTQSKDQNVQFGMNYHYPHQ